MQYNASKELVIQELYRKAFIATGLLKAWQPKRDAPSRRPFPCGQPTTASLPSMLEQSDRPLPDRQTGGF